MAKSLSSKSYDFLINNSNTKLFNPVNNFCHLSYTLAFILFVHKFFVFLKTFFYFLHFFLAISI